MILPDGKETGPRIADPVFSPRAVKYAFKSVGQIKSPRFFS
jgi:hypothetical protein